MSCYAYIAGLLTLCDETTSTVMRRLTTGIRSEKRVVRRFRRCSNVIQYTYTNLGSTAYYTPSLYDKPIAPRLQTCTACYCTEYISNCNTIVSIIILWDHRRICGPPLTKTSLCGVWLYCCWLCEQWTCIRKGHQTDKKNSSEPRRSGWIL